MVVALDNPSARMNVPYYARVRVAVLGVGALGHTPATPPLLQVLTSFLLCGEGSTKDTPYSPANLPVVPLVSTKEDVHRLDVILDRDWHSDEFIDGHVEDFSQPDELVEPGIDRLACPACRVLPLLNPTVGNVQEIRQVPLGHVVLLPKRTDAFMEVEVNHLSFAP